MTRFHCILDLEYVYWTGRCAVELNRDRLYTTRHPDDCSNAIDLVAKYGFDQILSNKQSTINQSMHKESNSQGIIPNR
jgi:hypothetical protein